MMVPAVVSWTAGDASAARMRLNRDDCLSRPAQLT